LNGHIYNFSTSSISTEKIRKGIFFGDINNKDEEKTAEEK
jgi:hypothetical protein